MHINYAKEAYHASNKKDFITQMMVWLCRQESIDHFDMYLDWKKRKHDVLAGGMEGEMREECEVEYGDNDGAVDMQHGLGEDMISHTPQCH